MSTVRDLVSAALRDVGAIASGEAMTNDEAADGLAILNDLVASWNLERLMVYVINEVTFLLTGAASYTYGTGGVINSARPVRLEKAALRLAGDAPRLDLPVCIYTDEEYHSLALPGLTSTYAYGLYLDGAYPLGTLRLWPVPPAGDTLVLWPWNQITAFAALGTTVDFPPGYARALRTNLAIELSPSYRDSTITPWLAAQALESKALIKIANNRPQFLTLPDGIPTGRQRSSNIVDFKSGYI